MPYIIMSECLVTTCINGVNQDMLNEAFAKNIITGDKDKGMAEGLGLGLTTLAPFDLFSEPTSLGQCWKAWKHRIEMYVATLNITDVKRKQALLLYQIGEATLFIFDTLSDTGDDYHTAMTKLDEYYSPKKMLNSRPSGSEPQDRRQVKLLISMLHDSNH